MSWAPAEQVLQAVANQRQALAEQQARIAGFNQYHATERMKLESDQRTAVADLGQAALPRLDAASIAAAAEAVGMPNLVQENIPAKLEARRAWLASRMQEINRNPNFAQRELLRHPATGSLVRAVNEAEEYRRIANEVCALCEMHPRFERLWSIGWGTAEEKSSWWRYSYWQDRSAAQEIMGSFPGKKDFAEVRAEYAKGKETVAVYDADIARLRGQIAAGEALEREYRATYEEHHNLDARGLEHTRGRVVQHLLGIDPSIITQRLRAASSPLLMLFLRASGLAAKITYLEGIQRNTLGELQREMAAQHEKLNGVEARTRRRWAPMPMDKFMKLQEDRRPRFEKRWSRFGKTYQTVYVYDRWDRARYYDDILWWDLMTRGRYDGSYIPEVYGWRQQHPGYQFDPDWKTRAGSYEYDDWDASSSSIDEAEAAAVSVDADHGDRGGHDDLQTTDAS